MLRILSFCLLALLALPSRLLFAAEAEEPLSQSVDQVIKKVEDNLNGRTAIMEMTMVVKTRRAERTMKMKSWAKIRALPF